MEFCHSAEETLLQTPKEKSPVHAKCKAAKRKKIKTT